MEMTRAFVMGFLKEAVAGCGAPGVGVANANPLVLAALERELAAKLKKAASQKVPFEVLRGAKTLGSMVRKMPVLSQIRMRQALMKNLMAQVSSTPEGLRYALGSLQKSAVERATVMKAISSRIQSAQGWPAIAANLMARYGVTKAQTRGQLRKLVDVFQTKLPGGRRLGS
jgi:hypothetical protein